MKQFFSIHFLLFCFIQSNFALQTYITDIRFVRNIKVLCVELVFKGIPFKQDFFGQHFDLTVKYYSGETLKTGSRLLKMRDKDDVCQPIIRFLPHESWHVTYVCGKVNAYVSRVFGILGVLDLKNDDKNLPIHLKKNSFIGMTAHIIKRENNINAKLCVSCTPCLPTCSALHYDINVKVCNGKTIIQPPTGTIVQPTARLEFPTVDCIQFKLRTSLHSSCEVLGIQDTLCKSTTNSFGHGYFCVHRKHSDYLQTERIEAKCSYGMYIAQSKIKFHLTGLPRHVMTVKFPQNVSHTSCSLLIKKDRMHEDYSIKIKRRARRSAVESGVGVFTFSSFLVGASIYAVKVFM